METLANLESFVRSAETGGFSAAARRLSLTPAAVSRNVAMLERNLGVRLFQRSTRKLTLTEAGERFLHAVQGQSRRIAGFDRERRHRPGRTGRRTQGQHGHDVWRRIHPAAAAGFPETLPARSRRLAVREPAGRPDCRRIRRRDRRRDRSRTGPGVAGARARPHHRGRLTVLHDGAHAACRPPGPRRLRRHCHAFIAHTPGSRAADAERRGRRDVRCRSKEPSCSTTPRQCVRLRCSVSV